MTREDTCWCGSTSLSPLGDDYAECRDCGTAVYRGPYDPDEFDAAAPGGFYGDSYWLEHVPGADRLPGLAERARSDLRHRTILQLRRVLEHLPAGRRVLEIGCGHGALVHCLSRCGFEAIGLEVSDVALAVARERFGLELRRGPIESAGDLGQVDAIVAIDVVEHLPWPQRTLAACRERLAPGGLLLVQTPRYRGEGADWPMFVPREHLFLHTERSIRRLLELERFALVEISEAVFPHDMWVVASAGPRSAERPDPWAAMPPELVALAELVREKGEVDEQLAAARADQRAKEELIVRVDRELKEVRADQRAKEELIARLDVELRALHAEQAAREALIVKLANELDERRAAAAGAPPEPGRDE